MKKLFYILLILTLTSCVVIEDISYSFSKENRDLKKAEKDFLINYSNYYWEGEDGKTSYKLIVDKIIHRYAYEGRLIINYDTLKIANLKGRIILFNDSNKNNNFTENFRIDYSYFDSGQLYTKTNQRILNYIKTPLTKKQDYFYKPFLKADLIQIQKKYGYKIPVIGHPSFYHGILFKLKNKASLFAVLDGEVIKTSSKKVNTKNGKYITIKHSNNLTSKYAHLSKIKVRVGDKIKKGQKIGISGNTGATTINGLGFFLFHNDSIINPNILFNKNEKLNLNSHPAPKVIGIDSGSLK